MAEDTREWVVLYKPSRRVAAAVWATIADVPSSATIGDVEAALQAWPRWPQWQARVGVGGSLTVARRNGRHDVDAPGVGRHTWAELAPGSKAIGLRVSGALYAAVSRSARADGVHLSQWCIGALLGRLAEEGIELPANLAALPEGSPAFVDVALPGLE